MRMLLLRAETRPWFTCSSRRLGLNKFRVTSHSRGEGYCRERLCGVNLGCEIFAVLIPPVQSRCDLCRATLAALVRGMTGTGVHPRCRSCPFGYFMGHVVLVISGARVGAFGGPPKFGGTTKES